MKFPHSLCLLVINNLVLAQEGSKAKHACQRFSIDTQTYTETKTSTNTTAVDICSQGGNKGEVNLGAALLTY